MLCKHKFASHSLPGLSSLRWLIRRSSLFPPNPCKRHILGVLSIRNGRGYSTQKQVEGVWTFGAIASKDDFNPILVSQTRRSLLQHSQFLGPRAGQQAG